MEGNIFKDILFGSEISPPDGVADIFYGLFKNPMNVEWYKHDTVYEAIFYEDDVEKIARFTEKGMLLESRINLTLLDTPSKVKAAVAKLGEVMNCIEIQTNMDVYYELIVRDSENNRSTVILDKNAGIIRIVSL